MLTRIELYGPKLSVYLYYRLRFLKKGLNANSKHNRENKTPDDSNYFK
jgi:hypothetical protein